MRNFRCPSCEQETIAARDKWSSSSFAPVTCSNCKAQVYASGKQSSIWRISESLMVTLVIILAFMTRAVGLIVVIALIVVVMELLRLFLVPLVKLEHVGGGFR